ncbi:MAG: deoxyribodipyrimidine photo-lyase [Rhodospirillaceae bacterium]|nr:deoxyribodipyrimidine photo-lyase [Rhodospirillaceae bacterium]
MSEAAIVWFRDDLRLSDHPALDAAAALGEVIPVFVLDATMTALGGAARWWLHYALAALGADIARQGGALTLVRGTAGTVLADVAERRGVSVVHALASRHPVERAEQDVAGVVLARRGVRLVLHKGALLHDPAMIRTGQGGAYTVFTPFWRVLSRQDSDWLRTGEASPPIRFAAASPELDLDDLALLPRQDWAAGLRAAWMVGEDAAAERLEAFVQGGLRSYATDRDRPDRMGTSRLSPDLRWGALSPLRIWRRVRAAMIADPALDVGGWAFLRQLGWREFAHHVLAAHPDMARCNIRPGFDSYPWDDDAAVFRRWTQGETGYPLVDAGMRELWNSGWMHNRVRMVAASFLVKDLRQDWRAGLAWFDDTLVDADPALDPFGWQWVAGSGADATPYFRIFNPTTQARTWDPDGAYIARWLPARAALPPPERLAPQPDAIVDHAAARNAALAAYREFVRK